VDFLLRLAKLLPAQATRFPSWIAPAVDPTSFPRIVATVLTMTSQPDTASDESVFVRVAAIDQRGRQIKAPSNIAETLSSRLEDVRKGVAAGTRAVSASMAAVASPNGWQVESVEATFGITLGSEGSVIVAKASLEASFEVTVTYQRQKD
jgi:hypothetical protein